MKKCKECGREEWGFLSVLNEDGYCQRCATVHYEEKIKKLQEQLDIVTEQRNDIHIDNQVLQIQLKEANDTLIKSQNMKQPDRNNFVAKYLLKWGVK